MAWVTRKKNSWRSTRTLPPKHLISDISQILNVSLQHRKALSVNYVQKNKRTECSSGASRLLSFLLCPCKKKIHDGEPSPWDKILNSRSTKLDSLTVHNKCLHRNWTPLLADTTKRAPCTSTSSTQVTNLVSTPIGSEEVKNVLLLFKL